MRRRVNEDIPVSPVIVIAVMLAAAGNLRKRQL
jgi:hypothetical protein